MTVGERAYGMMIQFVPVTNANRAIQYRAEPRGRDEKIEKRQKTPVQNSKSRPAIVKKAEIKFVALSSDR